MGRWSSSAGGTACDLLHQLQQDGAEGRSLEHRAGEGGPQAEYVVERGDLVLMDAEGLADPPADGIAPVSRADAAPDGDAEPGMVQPVGQGIEHDGPAGHGSAGLNDPAHGGPVGKPHRTGQAKPWGRWHAATIGLPRGRNLTGRARAG